MKKIEKNILKTKRKTSKKERKICKNKLTIKGRSIGKPKKYARAQESGTEESWIREAYATPLPVDWEEMVEESMKLGEGPAQPTEPKPEDRENIPKIEVISTSKVKKLKEAQVRAIKRKPKTPKERNRNIQKLKGGGLKEELEKQLPINKAIYQTMGPQYWKDFDWMTGEEMMEIIRKEIKPTKHIPILGMMDEGDPFTMIEELNKLDGKRIEIVR